MHPMPSELARALAEARAGDIRRQAAGPRRPARAARRAPATVPLGHAREAAGWWLVSIGLRLAAPGASRAGLNPAGR